MGRKWNSKGKASKAEISKQVHAEVVEAIVAAMEQGIDSWRRTWRTLGQTGFPCNGNTGRRYSGVNVLILAFAPFADRRWYTFNGGKNAGGKLNKGSKGTRVVYVETVTINRKTGEVDDDGDEVVETVKIPRVGYHTLFNREQFTWTEAEAEDTVEAVDPEAGFENAAKVLNDNGITVNHGGNRAFYSIANDEVTLPLPGQFETVADYWTTALHEAGHWTGAEGRCGREFGKRFGDDAYAFEELIAELTAAFASAHLGIDGNVANHASYLDNWIKVLKADKWALWTAAREAENATRFLLDNAGLWTEDNGEGEAKASA